MKVTRQHTIPPGKSAAIWVTAPVRALHLVVPKGIRLKQRGVALANGDAHIIPTRAFCEYVSKFSRIPVRLIKGINIGTVRPLTPKPLNPDGAESEPLLLADDGPTVEKGEGNRLLLLFAESMD